MVNASLTNRAITTINLSGSVEEQLRREKQREKTEKLKKTKEEETELAKKKEEKQKAEKRKRDQQELDTTAKGLEAKKPKTPERQFIAHKPLSREAASIHQEELPTELHNQIDNTLPEEPIGDQVLILHQKRSQKRKYLRKELT